MKNIVFTTIMDNSYRSTFIQPRVIFERLIGDKHHNKEGPSIIWSDGLATFDLYGSELDNTLDNCKTQKYKSCLILMAYLQSFTAGK